ncbi:MAG: class I SAM-dependent methyltransferase [Ornithinimicrobium sp.]
MGGKEVTDHTPDFGPISEVDVEVEEALRANRANWDDRAVVHGASEHYDLAALAADSERLSDVVTADLPVLSRFLPAGSLSGLDVVHLQCHIGTDTLSLSRSGARVTGVDFSAASLSIARRLAGDAGHDIRYVESDVMQAAAAVGGQADVVYTSVGTICWLPDLNAWARNIAQILRPGGVFYFRDSHPMLHTVDDMGETPFTLRTRYFASGRAQTFENASTYTDGDPTAIRHTRNYEWPHPVSETVQALLDAGLRLRFIDEGRSLDWQALPEMVPRPQGDRGVCFVLPPPWDERLPLTLTLIASKD